MYASRKTIFASTIFTLMVGMCFFFFVVVRLSGSPHYYIPNWRSGQQWLQGRTAHELDSDPQSPSQDAGDANAGGSHVNGHHGSNTSEGTGNVQAVNRTSIDITITGYTAPEKAGQKSSSTLILSEHSNSIQNFTLPRIHKLPDSLKDLTIIYYIVPKCGSRTFFYLMGRMKELNPNLGDVLAMTSAEEETRESRTKRVPKFVAQAKKPAFLYVDTHFVKVKYPKNVLYVSVVRDPLSRFLSQFAFHNYGDNYTAPKDEPNWMKSKRATLDECVRTEQQICSGRWLGRGIHSRFCGTGVVCYQTCPKNFKQSKRNLQQKYNVVGMLEEFEDFLRVLERLVPAIFDGILDLYRHPSTKEFMSGVKTAGKVEPSEETLAKLKTFLRRDYEFYEAVRGKFYHLKEKLGLNSGNETI